MARRLGDPELLERVFEHRLTLLTALPFLEQRLAEIGEMLELLGGRDASSHRRFIWLGNRSQVHEQLGQVDEGLALVAEMGAIVEQGDLLPRQRVFYDMHVAGWEILAGNLAQAEASIRAAFGHIKTLGSLTLGAATARQMLAVRFWQDRVDTMLDAVATGVTINPTLIAHHAYWLLQDGQIDEAAKVWDDWDDAIIEQLFRTGVTVESTVVEAAGVCAVLGAPQRCRVYYDLLAPYGDRLVNPYAPDQPTHHFLGLLARAMGDADLAASHLESSIRFAVAARAPLMAGRSSLELARTLQERDREPDRVIELAHEAEQLGRRHLSAWLIGHATAFLDEIGAQ